MPFISKIIEVLRYDHQQVIADVKVLKDSKCTLKHRHFSFCKICPKITQICKFEDKIIHGFMRARLEDEFQVMVLVGVEEHSFIFLLIDDLKSCHLRSKLWPIKSIQLATVIENHIKRVEDYFIYCMNYYLNYESDRRLFQLYLDELVVEPCIQRASFNY